MFHNRFIKACLPIIYGADWERCSERVLREYGIDRIHPEVLIQTPRRFGKTVSVSMFVLALLLACPGIRICVFSTSQRASSNLVQEIKDRLSHLPGGTERIVRSNSEQLFISTVAQDESNDAKRASKSAGALKNTVEAKDISRLFSFPAGTASEYTHA